MKKIFIIISSALLVSCQSMGEQKSLSNEKIKTTDEFLVKKKEPLEIPPDVDEIPTPGSLKNSKKSEDEKIKNILKTPEIKNNKNKVSNSTEKTILDKIRK